MSKWEKLMARLNKLSPDLQFEELRRILLEYGFEERQPGRGGSHHTFCKGETQITLPKHQRMLKVYVEAVRDAVSTEEDLNGKNS